jgi:DNA mismatch repair protein MutL
LNFKKGLATRGSDYLSDTIIKILDANTANKIAAGEVIERPSSVVKELIENSIDAKASQIKIEIIDGGIKKICVSDNGHGIVAEQVAIALKRHATSKIRLVEDLFNVKTYGFRGEALPSIAAVSKVTVITKHHNSAIGVRYVIQGGSEISKEDIACNTGTQIIVENLFFNVPPRRSLLKSQPKEAGFVGQVVMAMALAKPQVHFKYYHNKKLVFQSSSNANLSDTIINLMGSTLFKGLVPVSYHSKEQIVISGYVSRPQHHRATRQNQYFFINGRWIITNQFNKAISRAYHTLIPSNRFPILILNLEMPHKSIDVNVHPTKREVKFLDKAILENLLIEALSKVLKTTESVYSDVQPRTHQKVQIPRLWNNIEGIKSIPEIATNTYPKQQSQNEIIKESNKGENAVFPTVNPIFQIDGTYILATSENTAGFYIIDQHAAHERIFYDQLSPNSSNKEGKSQVLLEPQVIDLTPSEAEFIVQIIDLLSDTGFIIEHFGDSTFLLRGAPVGLEDRDLPQMVKDVLDKYTSGEETFNQEQIIKLVACKKAIKANQPLTQLEMKELLKRLSETKVPYTCPHGRPTIIHVNDAELKRRFHR